ncbi:MAG: L-rhamnose isomerase [Candidatus Pacebacteria bacterium]|nr:L-rhamnose isomerase [Candidatus Paceibacterota bacterium]
MFTQPDSQSVQKAYEAARARYADVGVDTDKALHHLAAVAVSVHCWQGDDVAGFEVRETGVGSGGIMATGNYPGAARNGEELRADLDKAFSLIPGVLRCNLHAIYAETDGKRIERDQLQPNHFSAWIDWAVKHGIALDFNPTYFAHPMADSGYTLGSRDETVRQFWIRHGIACRRIAEAMGRAQNSPCVINHWVPDGAKDHPVDRWGPRERLAESLDTILAADVDRKYCKDSVESKLFGIGSEDYVVGSHEFYMGYGLTQGIMICFDMGHFHPTETISDKLSSLMTFQDEVLLHVSRGVRWDSDHVVTFNDDVKRVFHELVRGNALEQTHVALDFFDASINRIGAWVIGTRATLKAALYALLEPTVQLREMAHADDLAGKLALLEELKSYPFGAVWDYHCLKHNAPVGPAWLDDMYAYDRMVIRNRLNP